MTDERMALKALVEKTSDADILNEMIGFAANRLMAIEADTLCKAGRHERTADRINYRNGYRDRTWETRAGTVELEIPSRGKAPSSRVFRDLGGPGERRRLRIRRASFQGFWPAWVTARSKPGDLPGFGGAKFPGFGAGSAVGFQPFLTGRLEGAGPSFGLAETFVKVPKAAGLGRVRVLVPAGNRQGRRGVPGITGVPLGAGAFRAGFLRLLAPRGLGGVKPGIRGGDGGVKAAGGKGPGPWWEALPCPLHAKRARLRWQA